MSPFVVPVLGFSALQLLLPVLPIVAQGLTILAAAADGLAVTILVYRLPLLTIFALPLPPVGISCIVQVVVAGPYLFQISI